MLIRPRRPANTIQDSMALCVLIGAGACTDLDPAMPMLRPSNAPDASAPLSDRAGGALVDPLLDSDWLRRLGDAGRTVGVGRPDNMSSSALNNPESGFEEPIGRRPLGATLGVDGEDLFVTLRNYTALPAAVLLRWHVDMPDGSYAQSAGNQLLINGGEEFRLPFRARQIEGLDVTRLDWSRTVLQYDFTLQDGRHGAQSTELAIHHGRVVPVIEAIDAGRQLPDLMLERSAAEEELQTGMAFSACFRNVVDLQPQISDTLPTACAPQLEEMSTGGCLNGLDRMIQNQQALPMPGQTFWYVAPDGTMGAGNLDASGCTPSLETQAGSWKFRIYLHAQHRDPSRAVYFLDSEGRLAFAEALVMVAPSGIVPALDIQVLDVQRSFQAAVLLANNTIERANGIRAVSPQGDNVLRISPSSIERDARYCHVVDANCSWPLTLRVSADVANDRGLIAHETGHFIHAHHLACPSCSPPTTLFATDYSYSDADANNPNDPCRRTPVGHDMDSVEWQSAAHWEGLANFFAALSYNEYAGTDRNCQLPYHVGAPANVALIDCEAPGRTPAACAEWQRLPLFDKTGNPLDWTKMYWDFLTDHSVTDWSTYFLAERTVGARWPLDGRGNHFDLIWPQLRAFDATQGDNFYESSGGNILDGTSR